MNDETSKLIAKVERFARQEQLFAPAEPGRALHLCAAVSGGADSMALLRVLLELRETFGYPLTACHVNHGLRGEAADRDEAFVRVSRCTWPRQCPAGQTAWHCCASCWPCSRNSGLCFRPAM